MSCLHENCNQPIRCRGLCRKHYNYYYHNKKSMPRTTRGEDIEAFISGAVSSSIDECIEWPFVISGSGYGQLWINGGMINAHRYICTIVHGEPKNTGLVCAHSCNNRKCVNPNHLRWATQSENNQDKIAHGTHRCGEDSSNAVLTEDGVREIRRLRGVLTQPVLAKMFGVSQVKISQIQLGKAWAHVK